MNYLLIPLKDNNVEVVIKPLEKMTQAQAEEKGVLFESLPPSPEVSGNNKAIIKMNSNNEVYYEEGELI